MDVNLHEGLGHDEIRRERPLQGRGGWCLSNPGFHPRLVDVVLSGRGRLKAIRIRCGDRHRVKTQGVDTPRSPSEDTKNASDRNPMRLLFLQLDVPVGFADEL